MCVNEYFQINMIIFSIYEVKLCISLFFQYPLYSTPRFHNAIQGMLFSFHLILRYFDGSTEFTSDIIPLAPILFVHIVYSLCQR